MILYSLEEVYNFKCYNCKKSWSITDWLANRRTMICPHCGIESTIHFEEDCDDKNDKKHK